MHTQSIKLELSAGRSFTTTLNGKPAGEFYLSYGKDRYNNPLWKASFAELDDLAHTIEKAVNTHAMLVEALKSIPSEALNCQHQYPHLYACWNCKVRKALAVAEGKGA